MYDEADNSTYAYASSDDDLFSEATTIPDELDDIDELRAMSPDSNLAPEADVEAASIIEEYSGISQLLLNYIHYKFTDTSEPL